MTRSKLRTFGLCAVVLGMVTISASSAQAALSWLVLNSKGTEAKELKAQAYGHLSTGVTGTLLTRLVGLKVGVTCTFASTAFLNLEAGGKLTEGSSFTGSFCSVSEGGKECTVKSPGRPTGTIESNGLKGELVLHSTGAVLVKIQPQSAEAGFATLRFEGECALPEVNKVNGTLYLKDTEATTHKEEHSFTQGPLTSLTIGTDTAEHLETSLDGQVSVYLLASHFELDWAAMDV
jgi:hypothetical protein